MIKCKKCRKGLLDIAHVVNGHNGSPEKDESCDSQVWYVKDDVLMEVSLGWVRCQIDESEWLKGKLTCPHGCGARLGSFNFISGLKCSCSQFVVPPVHLIKKRVDLPYKPLLETKMDLEDVD